MKQESEKRPETVNRIVFVAWMILLLVAGIYMAYKFING
jgi:hypothetical protein